MEHVRTMKWRTRFIFVTGFVGACLVTVAFFPEMFGSKSFRKEQLAIGQSRHKVKSDVYPGKAMRKPYWGAFRELQGKSRSADQESPDDEELVRKGMDLADKMTATEEGRLLKSLIGRLSADQDQMRLQKILRAAYLIANDTSPLGQELDDVQMADQKPSKPQSGTRPPRVQVTAEDLDLLVNLEPRDVRWSVQRPKKLFLKRENFASAWDG